MGIVKVHRYGVRTRYEGSQEAPLASTLTERKAQMTTAPTPVPRGHTSRRLYPTLLAVIIILAGTIVFLFARGDSGNGPSATTGLRGSGVAASASRVVPAFFAVDLAGSSVLTVRVGPQQAVVVHADDNLIDLVTTDVEDGTLVVGTSGSFTTQSPMTVDVTVPTLETVVLSGSGVVTVEGVTTERLVVRAPGSGVLTVSGTAEQLDVSLTGSGDVRLEELVARDVAATLSGSGRLQVHATDSLEASVPGTGVIVYRGNPSTVTTDVSGTGVITKQ